jgi:hypothetical protein
MIREIRGLNRGRPKREKEGRGTARTLGQLKKNPYTIPVISGLSAKKTRFSPYVPGITQEGTDNSIRQF